MSMHHLGEQIDIHGGGNDLIFPHHENEIAQTESFSGKSFAKYWVHNGMLQLSSVKMSKSLGNMVTIQEFLDEHDSDVFRLMILNSSYRSPLTFNDEVISGATKGFERLRSAMRPALSNAGGAPPEVMEALTAQISNTRQGFLKTMDDDFNSAGALGHIFDLVRAINQTRDSGATEEDLEPAQDTFRELTGVFGLRLEQTSVDGGNAGQFIDFLVELRTDLREDKQWALADNIRNRLAELGVLIEDEKEGTTWRWK